MYVSHSKDGKNTLVLSKVVKRGHLQHAGILTLTSYLTKSTLTQGAGSELAVLENVPASWSIALPA